MLKKVAKIGDVKEKLCVKLDDKKLALFNIKGKFYCIDNSCSHAGGPLCKGSLDGFLVSCLWHNSKFDIKTGKVKAGPAVKDIKSYKVVIKNNEVFIDI